MFQLDFVLRQELPEPALVCVSAKDGLRFDPGQIDSYLSQIAPLGVARAATPAKRAGYAGGKRVAGWPPMTTRTVADVRQTIAENIVLGRKLAGISQKQLARRLELADEKEISRYENGRRTPGRERLIRIAAELGQSVGWFHDPHDGTP